MSSSVRNESKKERKKKIIILNIIILNWVVGPDHFDHDGISDL